TVVGVLPAALVYTFAGSQAGAISSLNDLVSPRLLLALLCISLLTLSPLLWKKAKEWKQGRQAE
ncbi:MAG TPA: TVP38/TMEM64 family protein, partial [Syntrophorhabdus aromaticivorans]|nr:TVP38/TMEM64 family protein [Syntrophorhabdus aromaticivorans]